MRPTHCPICHDKLGPPSEKSWCCIKEDHEFDAYYDNWIFAMNLKEDGSEFILKYKQDDKYYVAVECWKNGHYVDIFKNYQEYTFEEALTLLKSIKENFLFV